VTFLLTNSSNLSRKLGTKGRRVCYTKVRPYMFQHYVEIAQDLTNKGSIGSFLGT